MQRHAPMKVLVIHNAYRQRGGEAVVVAQEIDLLRAGGHTVVEYHRSNDEVADIHGLDKLGVPLTAVWSRRSAREVREIIRREQPDVAHVHNTHFRVSPSVIHACKSAGVPVVCTLHNYRLVCPAATMFRDGAVCEDCLDKWTPYPGVIHGCFRDSRAGTAAVVLNITAHRLVDTYRRVDQFIAPTHLARSKLVAGGVDGARIAVKPHFLRDDPVGLIVPERDTTGQRYALFVGRLSAEKGIDVLLEAWSQLPDVPLRIVGDGPLRETVERRVREEQLVQVTVLGSLERAALYAQMHAAYLLVLPSVYYETFGMVALESLATGTPVMAFDHGAPAELIADGVTGWHVRERTATALATAVQTAWALPAATMATMRQRARETYLDGYTAERNSEMLMEVYRRAMEAGR